MLAGRARRRARARRPRRVDAHVGADPRRHPAHAPRAGGSRSPRPTWSCRCARSLDAEVEGEGARRRPRPAARRARAAAARRARSRSSTAPRRACCASSAARTARRLQHVQRRGLPAAARRSTRRTLHSVDRAALLETVSRVSALRVAGRVAPGADRHPRPLRGRQARDGRDRLVPALREGDADRGRPAGARGDRPGARARRSSAASRRAATAIQLGVHENQVIFGADGAWLTTRRIDGQFPNYQQLLPETLRARGHAAPRRAARGRPPHGGAGAAQLAAAPALRRGRADGLARRRRTSARPASRCRRAFAGEPLEIGFNAEFLRDGIESVAARRAPAQADQPAAPGGDPGRRATTSCT